MKKIIIAIVILLVVVLGAYYFVNKSSEQIIIDTDQSSENISEVSTSTLPINKEESLIANSVLGLPIKAYHFGGGQEEVVFIGGIHGAYGYNTSALAYEISDYLKATPSIIPANLKVTVIPLLNPDGFSKVFPAISHAPSPMLDDEKQMAAGRFNGNSVDLNRNFDCDWQTNAKWQDKDVSGGPTVFSEPEALGLKNYIEANKPKAVIVFYSAVGGVFASNCHSGILPDTKNLVSVYAKTSGYPAHEVFNYYETTGDLTNWLSKIGIPAISVLLTDHKNTEWSKNKLGVEAVMKYFAK